MIDILFPTNDELLKLPLDSFRVYVSRCILRALPLTVGYSKFSYLDGESSKKSLIAALNLQCVGFTITPSLNESIDKVLNVAEEAVNLEAGYKAESHPEADVDASLDAKSIIRENSNVYLISHISAHTFDKVDGSNIHYAINAARLINSEIAYVDYLSLIEGDSLKGAPLWRNLEATQYWKSKYEDWYASLKLLGLDSYLSNYQKLLNGHTDPKQLYQKLYDVWRSGDNGFDELKQFHDEKDTDNGVAPEKLINLSGSLSINAEKPGSQDDLGRERLVDSIVELLTHPDQIDPLTIGLLGDWGAGKTTVLNLLEEALIGNKSDVTAPKITTKWWSGIKSQKSPFSRGGKEATNYTVETFNAWSYEHTESIQAGVAQSAIVGLNKTKQGSFKWLKIAWLSLRLQFNLTPLKTIGYSLVVLCWFLGILYLANNGRVMTVWDIGLGTVLTVLFLFAALKPFFSHPVTKEFMSFFQLPDFTSSAGKLPIYQLQVRELAKICLTDNKRLLFIVDDLDRCSPEGIVKVFEAIRLVMELDNVTVIVAIDHRIALSALAHHYEAFEGQGSVRNIFDVARDYLGKIIQLPINLEIPSSAMVDKYVDSLFADNMVGQKEKRISDRGSNSNFMEGSTSWIMFYNQELGSDHDESGVNITNEAAPEEAVNETMLHSQAEKLCFIELTHVLGFHNPRQLKRLHSSYRLLRAYTKSGESENLKYLCGLFVLEYFYNHEEEKHFDENKFLDFLRNKKGHANDSFIYLGKCFETENDYLSTKDVVKPFVLPRFYPSAK